MRRVLVWVSKNIMSVTVVAQLAFPAPVMGASIFDVSGHYVVADSWVALLPVAKKYLLFSFYNSPLK